MSRNKSKVKSLAKRAARSRFKLKKVSGGRGARLTIFRSARYLYVQLVDDACGKTLLSASTLAIKKEFENGKCSAKSTEAAKMLGKFFLSKVKEAGIKRDVVFDKGGYTYHGRIKVFADTVREGGLLKF